MNTLKRKNMMKAYQGFTGPSTVAAIEKQIPADLKNALTGEQLGNLMNVINAAYHNGMEAAGGEVIDASREDGAVYINGIGMITWKEKGAKYETITEPSYVNNGETRCGNRTYSKKIGNGTIELTADFI